MQRYFNLARFEFIELAFRVLIVQPLMVLRFDQFEFKLYGISFVVQLFLLIFLNLVFKFGFAWLTIFIDRSFRVHCHQNQ